MMMFGEYCQFLGNKKYPLFSGYLLLINLVNDYSLKISLKLYTALRMEGLSIEYFSARIVHVLCSEYPFPSVNQRKSIYINSSFCLVLLIVIVRKLDVNIFIKPPCAG